MKSATPSQFCRLPSQFTSGVTVITAAEAKSCVAALMASAVPER